MSMISVEMPSISKCEINECSFNVDNNCHAKAITIGDGVNPRCDTLCISNTHNAESKRIAGVGACKVVSCRFNNDFECSAESISVGKQSGEVKCLTFESNNP